MIIFLTRRAWMFDELETERVFPVGLYQPYWLRVTKNCALYQPEKLLLIKPINAGAFL
jgi:hypothetical protein